MLYIFAFSFLETLPCCDNLFDRLDIYEKLEKVIFTYACSFFWMLALGVSFSDYWYFFTLIPHITFIVICIVLRKYSSQLYQKVENKRVFEWRSSK